MASRQKSMRLADEAANAARRAVEIRRQLVSRRCINILRAHPWVAEDVERLLEDILQSLGVTTLGKVPYHRREAQPWPL